MDYRNRFVDMVRPINISHLVFMLPTSFCSLWDQFFLPYVFFKKQKNFFFDKCQFTTMNKVLSEVWQFLHLKFDCTALRHPFQQSLTSSFYDDISDFLFAAIVWVSFSATASGCDVFKEWRNWIFRSSHRLNSTLSIYLSLSISICQKYFGYDLNNHDDLSNMHGK